MNSEDDLVIQHATLIHARIEHVYDAFTSADGLDGWFTSGALVDPRPGGFILFRWVDWGPEHINAEDGGPVLEATPPTRLVFRWHPDEPSYTTTVEVDFKPIGEDTIVSLVEHGYHDTRSGRTACLNCATGWGEALTLLKFYAEHGLRY
jgi:uncharacterized protein YndB with AHSA1/START domain